MKKTFFTLAAAALLFSFTGCGNEDNDANREGTNDTEEMQPSNDGMNDGTNDMPEENNR